ncbi:hypothetical protein O6H91_07G060400 [Diphasiastrum complanatum]|uniref:Uncharacterized protein n=1 Tax=Diphasiastrum complanatum TaxID=34168 RepID=A0ACC2D5U5_DIPCM|nr:hypothetical protein O6H91_07G060400 [Diphasiastrum complanatum]
MSCWVFNVSSNNLSGAIPEGLIQDDSFRSFFDNPGLCGKDVEGLIACPGAARRSLFTQKHLKRAALWIGGIFLVAAFMGLLVGGGCFYFRSYLPHGKYFNKKEAKKIWNFTPFHRRLGFAEDEVLGSLDETNVIGSGGAGKVYKSTLKDGLVVAVKKLWTHGMSDIKHDNGFKAKVETLGRVRYKNIVKLLCCYSTPETKLLVYEYMPNGSLGNLLHGSQASILDWTTRYKIALGAAEGLAYLHRDYKPQVLHCDVKSNNILLDSNYEARIADFGLAKILEGYNKELSMSMIAGTYGYIAPEYVNTWKVREKSDIYSFGVVLLELATGKRHLSAEYRCDHKKKLLTLKGILENHLYIVKYRF